MYNPVDDLYISHEAWCGEGILGYTIPSSRRIYIDKLKINDDYDYLRVLLHEKQHNVNPDDSEYVVRLKTELRERDLGIPNKPSCLYS
jgi:hypothetical protein